RASLSNRRTKQNYPWPATKNSPSRNVRKRPRKRAPRSLRKPAQRTRATIRNSPSVRPSVSASRRNARSAKKNARSPRPPSRSALPRKRRPPRSPVWKHSRPPKKKPAARSSKWPPACSPTKPNAKPSATPATPPARPARNKAALASLRDEVRALLGDRLARHQSIAHFQQQPHHRGWIGDVALRHHAGRQHGGHQHLELRMFHGRLSRIAARLCRAGMKKL